MRRQDGSGGNGLVEQRDTTTAVTHCGIYVVSLGRAKKRLRTALNGPVSGSVGADVRLTSV